MIRFSSINKNGNYIYFDHTENALDSLETALVLLNRKSNSKWKWITICIHHSLYSFFISYLYKGNYEKVSSINKNTGKRELIRFDKALNKILNTPYYTYSKGKPKKNVIKLTNKERKKIDWLNDEIRNSFVHFIPQVTSVSIRKIKETCSVALNLIELLAIRSYAITYINPKDSQKRITHAINLLREHLA